jgi:hypothetical protein
MLIICQPESCCMCVHNTHARSSADSFAVGSGVWSVFVMSSLAYFGTQSRILFPVKRYFEGLTAKYFSRKIVCIYGISWILASMSSNCLEKNVCIINASNTCLRLKKKKQCAIFANFEYSKDNETHYKWTWKSCSIRKRMPIDFGNFFPVPYPHDIRCHSKVHWPSEPC